MRLRLTTHAQTAIDERGIDLAWVERTIDDPARTDTPGDGTTHFLAPIPERGGRVLRVITRSGSSPPMVITMFFDRRVEGLER